ncbi:MAG: biopolymer transporter ExbD [Spirochaetes bacterium]|nr:biopolymer transporter ExbD [Spirochaetota bacterium]
MVYKFKSRFQLRALIDMTPLIDLAFSLLIFFMLSYNASQGMLSSIIVNLPSAVQTGKHQQGNIVISITENNEIFINEKKVSHEKLLNELKAIKETMKDIVVIVRGDRKSNYETMVNVMDDLNRAGIPKFIISTIKKQ